ncbi:MAG TPA: S8 family peptidase [Nitrospira sp.]|nr:S8 family peptidase [Nitrospira sp.]
MKSRGQYLVVALSVCVIVSANSVSVHAQGRSEAALSALDRTPHVPNQVLVQFRFGTREDAKESLRERVQAHMEEVVVAQERRFDSKGDLELWNLPPGVAIAQAVRDMERDASIEFVEPNWIYQHQFTSNDPYYTNGSLWGMYGDGTSPSNLYGSQTGEAWVRKADCPGVYVGIIDEGVMWGHEDLAGNVWANPFDPVDGIDNDGNGYVDDVHGWDFAGNDNSIYDGSGDDHGTHVSGTVAGRGGNGLGVAGVCWQVQLISAKFLGRNGGTTANAVKAVNYITDLKTRHGLKIVATNNSWGGGGYSTALYNAIASAGAADILFVAAAGNSGANIDASPMYPAGYDNPNLISVAAIDKAGNLASWSNYGATRVDLGAPGVGIWSSVPTKKNQSAYSSYSGTSMATPHVTGAAALYAAGHPNSSASIIKGAILSTTVPTASLGGKTVTGGRLNTGAAFCSPSCP